MSGARRRIQFDIAGLLGLTGVLALSLGLLRYGLNRQTPISGAIAVFLGLVGIGGTAGFVVGYLVRGPAGAAWGAWAAAFLVMVAPVLWTLLSLLLG